MEIENAASGVYDLESGRHFCNMSEIPNCGGGGWTLAMKIDGTKVTNHILNTDMGCVVAVTAALTLLKAFSYSFPTPSIANRNSNFSIIKKLFA